MAKLSRSQIGAIKEEDKSKGRTTLGLPKKAPSVLNVAGIIKPKVPKFGRRKFYGEI